MQKKVTVGLLIITYWLSLTFFHQTTWINFEARTVTFPMPWSFMLASSHTFKENVLKLYGYNIISGVFHEDTIKHRWDYVDVCVLTWLGIYFVFFELI